MLKNTQKIVSVFYSLLLLFYFKCKVAALINVICENITDYVLNTFRFVLIKKTLIHND